jgi:hypothetical protein
MRTGRTLLRSGVGVLPEDATLVVYMPGRDLGRIARELARRVWRGCGVLRDFARGDGSAEWVAACRLDSLAETCLWAGAGVGAGGRGDGVAADG